MLGYFDVKKYDLDRENQIIVKNQILYKKSFSLKDIINGYIRTGYAGVPLNSVLFDSVETIDEIEYVFQLEDRIKELETNEIIIHEVFDDLKECFIKTFRFKSELDNKREEKLFFDLDCKEKDARIAFLPIVERICYELDYWITFETKN